MQKSVKVAYLLWLLLGWLIGAHRFYLKQEGWWIYPLLWFLTFFGIYLGPGAFTFLILVGFWIYDGFKIREWAKENAKS